MMNYKATVKNFIDYLKDPIDEKEDESTVGNKIRTLINLFLFSLLAIYLYGILLAVLESIHWIDAGVNVNSSIVYRYTYLKLILLGVVIAPVTEELIFRLPLRYKYNYLFRWTAILIVYIKHVDKATCEEKIKTCWDKYFKYFFYFIILIFGCVHFFNFSNYRNVWSWIIVLVFPQLIIGSILGYIRVRFSIIWSMGYHAFHNFVFFSFAFLNLLTLANYQFENHDYSFSMSKGSYTNTGENSFKVVPGKVIFENYKLTDVLEIVLKRPSKYFLKNGKGEMYVNINFLNKHNPSVTDTNLMIVSKNIQKAMKVKISSKLILKDVWELYIVDSIKYNKVVLPLLPVDIHFSLRRIGEFLDRQNKEIYIQSTDSIHQFYLNPNLKWAPFEVLKTSWKKQYGLGFRKIHKELEFINIE